MENWTKIERKVFNCNKIASCGLDLSKKERKKERKAKKEKEKNQVEENKN